MTTETPFLAMQAISKSFPGVKALNQVSFDLWPGEVHALVGENGAGKSTLMKILSGVYQPDAGEIFLAGQPVRFPTPSHAIAQGISTVHQELNLFQNLTVAENLFGGRMPARGPLGFEDRKRAADTARALLAQFDLPVSPAARLGKLSLAQQQVVEICKALVSETRVLILDEPTSSLTENETERLFAIIRRLRADGLAIVYISHRLEEIFEIADRVTVLRDGCWVDTLPTAETSIDAVIGLMVGRKLEEMYGQPGAPTTQPLLAVRDLSLAGRFAHISFDLHAGEILGLAGLMGAGRTDVGLSLYGERPPTSGQILLDGEPVRLDSPGAAMNAGLAYLSEDRQGDSLFLNLDVARNITVSHLEQFSTFGFLSPTQEKRQTQEFISRLNIQTPSPQQKAAKLSGGNQQKVVLARWLALQPRVFIVDEPTRGIDVGAKVEIYALLRRLAAQGVGILLISSEMTEILGLSDRVLVMHEGRLMGELSRAEATEERIMTLATRQAAETPLPQAAASL